MRFVEWLGHVVKGDLGTWIFTNPPVTLMIGQGVEPTLFLLVMMLTFSVGIAVPFRCSRSTGAVLSTIDIDNIPVPPELEDVLPPVRPPATMPDVASP